MKNKLEQLLTSLVEAWWKPRWEEEIKSCQIWESFYKRNFIGDTVWFYVDDRWTPQWLFTKSFREVCAKSSGLRQFVCENGMVKISSVFISWTKNASCDDYWNLFWDKACPKDFYQYRLIESALKDESELEQFLLNNIKIDAI